MPDNPTRVALLEAVAEAAEVAMTCRRAEEGEGITTRHALDVLAERIAALRAHTPAPKGETVEVRAYVRLSGDGNAYIINGMGAINGRWQEPKPGAAIATITAHVPLPTIPTIRAEVEP